MKALTCGVIEVVALLFKKSQPHLQDGPLTLVLSAHPSVTYGQVVAYTETPTHLFTALARRQN